MINDPKTIVIGVIHFNLFSLLKVYRNVKNFDHVRIVCRSNSYLTKYFLNFFLKYKINIIPKPFLNLPNDPFWIGAKYFSDKNNVSFRKNAIDDVNQISHHIYYIFKKSIRKKFGKFFNYNKFVLQPYFQYSVAEDFKSYVYFLYHLKSLKINDCESKEYLFLLPNFWWSKVFVDKILPKFNNIKIYFDPFARLNSYIWWSKNLKKQNISLNKYYEKKFVKDENKNFVHNKINDRDVLCSKYSLSCMVSDNYDLDYKNNIEWLKHSKHEKSNFHIIYDGIISDYKGPYIKQLLELGVKINTIEQVIQNPKYTNRLNFLKNFFLFITKWRLNPFNSFENWLFFHFFKIINLSRPWKKFFLKNNILFNIDHNYGLAGYARALALNNINGYTIIDARSFYYDNADNSSNRAHDAFFCSGLIYKNFFTRANPLWTNEINTGLSADGGNYFPKNIIKTLKNSSFKKILVIDEPGQIYGGENVSEFLEKLLKNCINKKNHILIFKPKRIETIFYSLNLNSKNIFKKLFDDNFIFVLSHNISISACNKHIDLCVSLPSSAMFYTIAEKIPTFIYNPYNVIKTILNKKNHLNEIIFTDLTSLIEKVNKIIQKKDIYAVDEDLIKQLDSSINLFGNKRKALFVDIILENINLDFKNKTFMNKCVKIFNNHMSKKV